MPFINRASTLLCAAGATLVVVVPCDLIIHSDFFAGLDVAECEEDYVAAHAHHEGVGLAGMVDVVCAVAAARAVEAPTLVNAADAQLATTRAPARFCIRDSLSGVLCYFPAIRKKDCGKAALAVDGRLFDGKSLRELHRKVLFESEAARDAVRLIAYPRKLVAQAREVQNVNCAFVCL